MRQLPVFLITFSCLLSCVQQKAIDKVSGFDIAHQTAIGESAGQRGYKDIPFIALTYPPSMRDSSYVNQISSQPFNGQFNQLIAEGLSEKKGWKWIDGQVRKLLDANKLNPYVFALRQRAAIHMLMADKIELLQYADAEALEAISYYTNQLDLGGSSAITLIDYCLRKLDGYWDNDKIEGVASRMLQRWKADEKTNVVRRSFQDELDKLNVDQPTATSPNALQAKKNYLTRFLVAHQESESQLQKRVAKCK